MRFYVENTFENLAVQSNICMYNAWLLSWQEHHQISFSLSFFHTYNGVLLPSWVLLWKITLKLMIIVASCMFNASFSLPFYLNFNIAIIHGTVFWITTAVCNWDMAQFIHIYWFYYALWNESTIKSCKCRGK